MKVLLLTTLCTLVTPLGANAAARPGLQSPPARYISAPDTVIVRTTNTDRITIRNDSTGALSIDSLAFIGPFTSTATFPLIIQALDSVRIPLGFDSTAPYTGSLTLFHSDTTGGPITIALRGLVGTIVTGNFSGTWTKENSPYRITGLVAQIPAASELVIEPGVIVVFDVDVPLLVLGRVYMRGTPDDSIVFTAGESPSWGGLRLASDSSSLAYVRISDAITVVSGEPFYESGGGLCVSGRDTRLLARHTVVRNNESATGGGGVAVMNHATAWFEHCLIENNYGSNDEGGGMLITDRASAYISASVIRSNVGKFGGGGIAAMGARLLDVVNSTVSNNSSDIAGGIYLHMTPGSVRHTRIVDNTSTYAGGGVGVSWPADSGPGRIELEHCLIERNTAPNGGGVLVEGDALCTFEMYACSLYSNTANAGAAFSISGHSDDHTTSRPATYLRNCVIASNSCNAISAGGAFIEATASKLWISHCTITGNTSVVQNSAALYFDGCDTEIVNSILWENSPESIGTGATSGPGTTRVTYSVVPNQQQLGTGCLISDPFFTGPDAGDYSLSTESPCIDTGDPDSPKDSDSTRADMGASSLVTRITVAVNDARRLPPRAELLPNAPNPFNPATTIRFNMPRGDNVRVAIYNVQGQLVRSVVNGWKHAGVHHTTWNGTDASGRSAASGVYLCYMTTSSGSQARRMILLR